MKRPPAGGSRPPVARAHCRDRSAARL